MDNIANITRKMLMKSAKIRQQIYHDCIPDWTMYKFAELEKLEQNISIAMFGRVITENNMNATTNADDITNEMSYSERIDIINMLVEKICQYSKLTKKGNITCGIIYNVMVTYDERNTQNNGAIGARPVPIFRIIVSKDSTGSLKYSTKTVDNVPVPACETWYMDTNGRIYKSWTDYMKNNTLPKCTMVVPKDGIYQADPSLEITGTYSEVWLDIVQSPACNLSQEVLKYADIGITILGIGVAALLSIASFVTPIGPTTAIAGMATTGVTVIWTAGRCSLQLTDRYVHEESIKDKDAVRAWLCIAGSVLGLAASGGAFAIARSAENGAVVGRIWQAAYNTALVGDIAVNAIGVEHRGYSLYQKYRQDEITTIDVLTFAGHVLFFGSAVFRCKFAKDIIESTQGKIMQDYEATLRSKEHRKSYNRVKRNAARNSSNIIAKNAEIVRHIKKVNTTVDPIPVHQNSATSNSSKIADNVENIRHIEKVNTTVDPIPGHQNSARSNSSKIADNVENIRHIEKVNTAPDLIPDIQNVRSKISLKFDNLKVDDTKLIDPVFTVKNLIRKYAPTWDDDNKSLTNAIANDPKSNSIPNFFYRIHEKLFSYVKGKYPEKGKLLLAKKCESFADILVKPFRFAWDYFKLNIKASMEVCLNGFSSLIFHCYLMVQKILKEIIIIVCAALNIIASTTTSAFVTSLKHITYGFLTLVFQLFSTAREKLL